MEMRRKGASAPASLSFLTTTPESSVDSILFTWGLMGPVMAVVRAVAAFFTAMLAALLDVSDTKNDNGHIQLPVSEGQPEAHDRYR